MFSVMITIAIIAGLLYFLAYISPQTDKILYFFSGFFFLFAGILGFSGYGDIVTGETITYDYGNVTGHSNNPVIIAEIKTLNYSESDLFNNYLPLTLILLSLYIFVAMFTNLRYGENDKQR